MKTIARVKFCDGFIKALQFYKVTTKTVVTGEFVTEEL